MATFIGRKKKGRKGGERGGREKFGPLNRVFYKLLKIGETVITTSPIQHL